MLPTTAMAAFLLEQALLSLLAESCPIFFLQRIFKKDCFEKIQASVEGCAYRLETPDFVFLLNFIILHCGEGHLTMTFGCCCHGIPHDSLALNFLLCHRICDFFRRLSNFLYLSFHQAFVFLFRFILPLNNVRYTKLSIASRKIFHGYAFRVKRFHQNGQVSLFYEYSLIRIGC